MTSARSQRFQQNWGAATPRFDPHFSAVLGPEKPKVCPSRESGNKGEIGGFLYGISIAQDEVKSVLADDVSIGAGARKKPDKQVRKLTRAELAIPDPGGVATTSPRLLRTFKTSEWPTWPSDHPYS